MKNQQAKVLILKAPDAQDLEVELIRSGWDSRHMARFASLYYLGYINTTELRKYCSEFEIKFIQDNR